MNFNEAAQESDDLPTTKRRAKTPAERLDELKAKEAQLQERIKREQAKIRTEERKKDTRRKIIAGALALEHMEYDEAFAEKMRSLIVKHAKDTDKALFEF